MKRPRLISKGSLSRLFEEAVEAWRRQDYAQTIELLERAGSLDPANPRVFLDLGRAHGMRYDYPAAEKCFERAVRISPNKKDALLSAGLHAHEFGNYDLAGKYLERAIAQNGGSPEIFTRLAELYERRHRLDEAAAMVERALKSDPAYAPALLARARQQRAANQLEDAEKLLRSFVRRTDGDGWTRVRGWYELGSVLDRQARYDEAMSAFLEAKALLRPAAGQHSAELASVQARVREMEETISPAVLQRWSEAGVTTQPQRRLALLCGHPRSGTTLLEQVLDSHPEVVAAEETHILHDEAYLPLTRDFPQRTSILQVLDSVPPSLLRQSRENYFRFTELFLGQPLGERLLIDKNPALNVLIPAVVRIFPDAKFLVALRDPRDVCLSCFMQTLPLNPVSSAYLTLEGTAVQYASVMGFWRTLLPRMRNPHLEVRYEDLVNNLEATSRRALEFLNLPWNAGVLRFDENARRKLVRSPTYADVTKPIFKTAVGRWRNYEKYLEPWLGRLEPFVKAFGY